MQREPRRAGARQEKTEPKAMAGEAWNGADMRARARCARAVRTSQANCSSECVCLSMVMAPEGDGSITSHLFS